MLFEGLIRPAAPEDVPNLQDIWWQASRQAHPFLSEEQLVQQYGQVRDRYLPLAEIWVAEGRDGRLSGFVALLDHLLGGLFVAPDQQRQGVGRALMAQALTGKDRLLLGVYAQNTAAVAFYLQLGFVELGRYPHDDAGLPFEVLAMAWVSAAGDAD